MSLDDFQLLDNEPIDNSIMKRENLEIDHQQGALLNDPRQNIEINLGENNKHQQVGKSHLRFDITVRKANGKNFNLTNDPATNEVLRLVNNALACCFKEGTLSTWTHGN